MNQEQQDAPPPRPSSDYAAHFRSQAKSSLAHCDVAPLLARFEDVSLFKDPHRKPLTVVLHEIVDARRRLSVQCSHPATPATDAAKAANVLQRQATAIILRRRSRVKQPRHTRRALCSVSLPATSTPPVSTTDKPSTRQKQSVLPSRVLFDDSRWPRSSRCDYCQLAGGDLECATCDVVAHAPCYLSDFGASVHKQKAAFVVPTRLSWLCRHCQLGLQAEYDARAADARAQQLAQQRQLLGSVLTAYLRMAKDARVFARKKLAVVQIQAVVRGRLARWRFVRMQRTRVRPYTLEALRVFGRVTPADGRPGTAGVEELRLANGFSCNPFLYVTVCDGEDDALQLFSFETSLRKGLFASEGGSEAAQVDVVWPEKLFVPGMNGNASFTFTLLSKNGPNNFFLGQAVLRLVDEDNALWRDGGVVELVLRERVEVQPKTAQKQPLRLAHPNSASHSVWASQTPPEPSYYYDDGLDDVDLYGNKPRLKLSLMLRPRKDVQAHCGYMGLKTTLDASHASPRWCVLADGLLRVYRHYGVTVASETVDMARALDVRLERGVNSQSSAVSGLKRVSPPRSRLAVDVSGEGQQLKQRARRERRARAPKCVAIQHVTRLFVFECEHGEATRTWHKKLQAAQRQASGTASTSSTSSSAASGSPAASIAAVMAAGSEG